MKNLLLEKFKSGKQTIGTLTHLKSPTAIEAFGYTGLDYVMLDLEHSPVDLDDIASYLVAAKSAGLSALVRVYEGSRAPILKCLDAGADGVIVPDVSSVEEVKKLVEYAKFTPVGKRGYCMSRDGGWGYADCYDNGLTGYMEHANKESMLIVQCETVGFTEHIDEIISMEGVDGVLMGPYDLSMAMGIPGEFDNPEFKKVVADVKAACKKYGKMLISFTGAHEKAVDLIKTGTDSLLYNLDILVLMEGYRSMISKLKEETGI